VFKSEIFKNVSVLSGGVLLAQIVPFLFAPWIARIYDAQSFGEFAAILGILKVLIVIVNGRYDPAIVLPKKKADTYGLLIGNWVIALVFSVLVFVVLVIFQDSISYYLEIDFDVLDATLIMLCLLGMGFWQPINYLFIRNKEFLKMTYNKFVKSSSTVLFTILFGVFFQGSGVNGLVFGLTAGWLFIAVFSFLQSTKTIFNRFKKYSLFTRRMLVEYKYYPKYNALPAVLNSLGTQLGFYVFLYFFSTEVAGHYSFAKQYLHVPLSILGMSLSQVYFQRISEKYKQKVSILKEIKLLMLFLVLAAVLVCVIIVPFSEEIFIILFGEQWLASAQLSKLLIFAFSFQFVISPISMVLHALNKVKLASVFPLIYVISIGPLFAVEFENLANFLPIYVVAEIIPYVIYLSMIVFAVLQYEKGLINKQNVKA